MRGPSKREPCITADQQLFEVWWGGGATGAASIRLNPHADAGWSDLQEAAKATGAFPLALKARTLKRNTGEYNARLWRISADDPKCVDDQCRCETCETMPPDWGEVGDRSFETVNVDGGVTNNSPFDCATNELTAADPPIPVGGPPRSALQADRAVISLAPFVSSPQFSLDAPLDTGLLSILGQLAGTVIDQSRIEGEALKLTADPNVYSAFHISPSIDRITVNALASASMSAFGGFVAQAFRDHDYQLGRRNCQWFLQQYLGFPLDNVVLREYAPQSAEARARLDANFGMDLKGGGRGIALVPLMDELKAEVTVTRQAINRDLLIPLADQATDRARLLIEKLLDERGSSFVTKAAFKAAWLVLGGKLNSALLDYAGKNLAREQLVT